VPDYPFNRTYRIMYSVGLFFGRVVDMTLAPYRGIIRRRPGDEHRETRILSRLDSIKGRLSSVERKLRRDENQRPSRRNSFFKKRKVRTKQSAEQRHLWILEHLHDPESKVRCDAIFSAAEEKSIDTVYSLILLLTDPDREVSDAARYAIEEITGRAVDFDPDEDPAMCRVKVERLKSWWKEERVASILARTMGPSGTDIGK